MILITVRPHTIRRGYLEVAPGAYSEAGRQVMRSIPGIRWDRARRVYEGPAEAIETAGAILAAARIAKISREATDLPLAPSPILHPQLRRYQQYGAGWLVAQLQHSGGALLADEMGLGKTPTAIVALDRLAYSYAPERERRLDMLVVAPAIVVPHWRSQIARWCDPSADTVWRVVSYEGMCTAAKGGSKTVAPLADSYGAAVFDEAHYLANSKSQRSKVAAAVRQRCGFAIALTGTPIPVRVRDAWHPLDVLHPGRWGSWFDFTRRYCDGRFEEIEHVEKPVWNSEGASNLDELHTRLQAVMLRRTKAEVGTELPPRMRTVLEVEMPVSARRDLWRAAADLQDREGVARLLSRVESHKIDAAVTLAQDVVEGGGRPLILTTRRDSAERIAAALACPCAHGDTPPDARATALTSGDGAACSTIYAVTTGIDLVEFDCVIFVGLDWMPSTILQAEARIHRIGQTRNVSCYFLVGIGTIDEVVRERVIDRLEAFGAAVGDGDERGLAGDLAGESDDDLIASIVRTVRTQVKGKAA